MAGEETKPLLIKVNPSWNRQSIHRSMSIPTTGINRSISNVRSTNNDDVVKITSIINGDTANSWKIKIALASILVSVVLERVAFYGLVGNLVMFLNLSPLNWTAYSAVSAMFMFFGVSYIMSVVGGWISDSFLGRFKTMILSYFIYMCGYILLPFIAMNTDNKNVNLPDVCFPNSSSNFAPFGESCSWVITVVLIVIAIAAGMLKANICPFGSEQLARATQQTQLSFFNWFYWCINIGSFLGLGIITYVEQQFKFLFGFAACTVALGISTIIFIAGFPFYINRPPDGSILTNIFKIFREAFRNRREQLKLQQNINTPLLTRSSENVNKAGQGERKIPFLDYAKQHYGGVFHNSLVDDVKKLGMILAVFAVLIPYWLVYFQMQTTFMFQGLNMRLFFGATNVTKSNRSCTIYSPENIYSPEVGVAWFALCDALFVIILLPLFDRIIYPRMARAGYHFTFAKRIVLGMVFAAAAMVVAGVVEHFRWNSLNPEFNNSCFCSYISQKIGNTIYYASNMSVLWQIPQYTLIGISEVFTSVACLQFAVMVAPKTMKAAITGLYYFFCGIGSFLGSALVAIIIEFKLWFPNKNSKQGHNISNFNCWYPCGYSDPNPDHRCNVDYYFYVLAGCEGLGLVLFLIVARVYKLNIDELTFHSRLKNEAVGGSQREEGRNIRKNAP